MATDTETQAYYSTLELVSDDNTAHAPETDLAIVAPERDRTTETAQVAFGLGVEIAYDSTLPEVIAGSQNDIKNAQNSKSKPSKSKTSKVIGLSRRTFWMLVVAVVVILIGGNVGVGVGVGLRSSNASHDRESTPTTPLLLPSSPSTPFSIDHAILNDTSFAAVSTLDGNRHVFFQEQSGHIRECVFTSANGKWSTSAAYVVATNAKLYSPMSSFQISQNNSDPLGEEIYLFYIAANNSIAFQLFQFPEAAWTNDSFFLPNLSSNVVATGYRALSAINSDNSSSTGFSSLHLLYEGISGNITWMVGSWIGSSVPSEDSLFDWKPLAVSPTFPGEAPSKNNSGPLYLAHAETGLAPAIQGIFISYFENTFSIEQSIYNLRNGNSTDESVNGETAFGSSDIHQLDFTQDGFWIRNSTLETLLGEWPYVLPTVPYCRLASTSPSNSSITYVYRQLNQTMIAEETFDYSIGYWVSSNFSVST